MLVGWLVFGFQWEAGHGVNFFVSPFFFFFFFRS